MPLLFDSKLDEEFDINKNKITSDKYKTTDRINISYNFGLKVKKNEIFY